MEYKNRNVKECIQLLNRNLTAKGEDVSFSRRFIALEHNSDRIDYVYAYLEEYNLLPELIPDCKDNAIADEFRQKGNDSFRKKDNEVALELYTISVAYAESKTESLAIAYANRSAVLFETGYYKECLQDIKNALNNNYPEKLKSKLLTRREKCLKLQETQNKPPYHQEVPSIVPDDLILSATTSVGIRQTSDLGRHIVAMKDIKVGEVVAVEKPFSHVLSDQFFSHCRECLKLCYNLIPCENCTRALYCNKQCKENAKEFHRYECKILRTFVDQMESSKFLPLKIAMMASKDFLRKCDKSDARYRSDRYAEIHELVDNSEKRSSGDIYMRSVTAAIFYHLVKTFTDLFHTGGDEKVFKELSLKHLQTAACNFHRISELAPSGIDEEVGCGAYAFLSLFNHSCAPNVVRHSYGTTVVMRAIKTICCGEQLFDNYGYHYAVQPKPERQAGLREQYYFDCKCRACAENWPLYLEMSGSFPEEWNVDRLQNGDSEFAASILDDICRATSEVTDLEPHKLVCDRQEILKQCWALQANVRRKLI